MFGFTLCTLSILLFIAAICTVLVGIIASNEEILDKIQIYLENSEGLAELPMPLNFFVISAGGIFGILAVFVSLCGCCASMNKKRCCLYLLVVFSFLMFILFIVIGAIFVV